VTATLGYSVSNKIVILLASSPFFAWRRTNMSCSAAQPAGLVGDPAWGMVWMVGWLVGSVPTWYRTDGDWWFGLGQGMLRPSRRVMLSVTLWSFDGVQSAFVLCLGLQKDVESWLSFAVSYARDRLRLTGILLCFKVQRWGLLVNLCEEAGSGRWVKRSK